MSSRIVYGAVEHTVSYRIVIQKLIQVKVYEHKQKD
jgi:hypothetical protein